MKTKISHPFKVPEGFFDQLDRELVMNLDKTGLSIRRKTVAWQVLKYAAIITAAIFIGRGSVLIFPYRESTPAEQENITVDLVLSQVSEEDITDFLIENVACEVITE